MSNLARTVVVVAAIAVLAAGCSTGSSESEPTVTTAAPTTTTTAPTTTAVEPDTLAGTPGEFIARLCDATTITACDEPVNVDDQQSLVDSTCELIASTQELADTLAAVDPASTLTVDVLLDQQAADLDVPTQLVMLASIDIINELGVDEVCA